jgi:hypothetical protein
MIRDGYTARVRWAFAVAGLGLPSLHLMDNNVKGTGTARFGALCCVLAICVCLPAASARQAANDATAAKEPPTAKPTQQTNSATKPASPSASATKSTSATHATSSHRPSSRRRRSGRVRGQTKIDPERARTIQQALIREHYLSGEPTGIWNEASEAAMRRYQSDHGWQTKEVPDSRALISLGLGPSKDHLLNPESAQTTGPQAPSATPAAASPTPAPAPRSTPAPSSPPVSSPSRSDSSSPQ